MFGQEPYKLSVDVDLVLFNVTVLDHKGHVVSGLQPKNFRVYEDGKLHDIKLFRPEDIPATVGLVMDNSGSMINKRQEAVDAAIEFVRSSNVQDELFIVNFNDSVQMGLPEATLFSSDSSQLRDVLQSIKADGRTALYDGVAAALTHLDKGTHQKKALVVLSDGGDNASRQTLSDVSKLVETSRATIYTIGIYDTWQRDKNPKVLRELSKLTGGESYVLHNVKDLTRIWRQIAGGIRSQYTVGYTSSNTARDGAFRKVKIVAVKDGKQLEVRTRPGYAAPRE